MAKQKPTIEVRAPKDADDFVAGKRPAASGQASLAPKAPAANVQAEPFPRAPAANVQASTPERQPQAPKVRGLVQRADGGSAIRITVYLEPEVGTKLRRHCFENGLEVSDTAAVAVSEYVAKL